MRRFLVILAGMVAVLSAGAATITEDFSTDPLQNGWAIFGDTNLFNWNSTDRTLEVTWDSSQTNSYFYHKLGTILARDDDFSIAFDLSLSNATAEGFGFEIALGFLNYQNATNANFVRGTGRNSPNLVEWDYFPPAMYDATVSTFIISTNSSHYGWETTFPLELTAGDWFHVVMTFTASNQTLHTDMTDNGVPFGPINDAVLGAGFTDFRADMVSITSYNGANSMSSVLAHGVISNLVVTVPPPPVQNLAGSYSNATWRVSFANRTNWLYTLQRTTNFLSWTNVSPATPGVAGALTLADTNPPPVNAFYRVQANRP